MQNNEAPQSINYTIYYRGVSIGVTQRDPELDMKNFISKKMEEIDWALDSKGALPSWNSETNATVINKELLKDQKKTIPSEQGKINSENDWLEKPVTPAVTRENFCSIHNKPMTLKTGKWGEFYSHWLGKDQYGKSQYCNGKIK